MLHCNMPTCDVRVGARWRTAVSRGYIPWTLQGYPETAGKTLNELGERHTNITQSIIVAIR